jgi:predicted DNA-binding transcriptional regulator YafY
MEENSILKTKPFHPDFDEFFEDNKKDQVWFETIVNRELIQQILSYGKDVEVLVPESLKKMLQEQVEQMKSYYI